MPEWCKWFFDGLGTEIISAIIGVLCGGFIGYRIGKRKSKFIQIQESGSVSEQYQKGNLKSKSNKGRKNAQDSKSSFRQIQKAGDNSKQTQIGGEENV